MGNLQVRKIYEAPRLIKEGRLAMVTAKVSIVSVFPAPESDIRLKQDIRQIGFTAHGLPYYSFRYIGKAGLYEGVMAQDVLGVMPEAVVLGTDGYMRVDYEKLGVPFRRIH
jgi:hypothetical protein